MPTKIDFSDVIIVIPGILGSVLYQNGHPLWSLSGAAALRTLFRGGSNLRSLTLENDDMESELLEDGITPERLISDLHLLPGLWKIDGYSAITNRIKRVFDVAEGLDLFEFAYDWRRDNRIAAKRLKRLSDSWLSERRSLGKPDAKLIIIAHSMGGLVARYFLDVLGGYADTRALITIGTPYRGAAKALENLVVGTQKGPRELTEVVRSWTSVYQLLPLYRCYEKEGELNRLTDIDFIPQLDMTRVHEAANFHKTIQRCREERTERGYHIFPVVGTHQRTLLSACEGPDGFKGLYTLAGRNDGGDGTVPRGSAVPFEWDSSSTAMLSSTPHSSLQNAGPVLDYIEGVIRGLDLELSQYRHSNTAIILEVNDVFGVNEPVIVKAKASRPDLQLQAQLQHEPSGKVQDINFANSEDGWQIADFGCLEEGDWRIVVSGGEAAITRDAFVVL